jgi:hypothetical protein
MFQQILNTLATAHPESDISITADRLYPMLGHFVEYQHWTESRKAATALAFLAFNGKGDGGFDLAWTHTLGEQP